MILILKMAVFISLMLHLSNIVFWRNSALNKIGIIQ